MESDTDPARARVGDAFAGRVVEKAAAPLATSDQRARILIVDDEARVRNVLAEMLDESGYEVVQADSGAAALALCTAERFRLVITDLSMPGMSGWEMAAALSRSHPGLGVRLVTGWGEQVDLDQAARLQIRFVLAKPFSVQEVMHAVAAALDGGAPRGRTP